MSQVEELFQQHTGTKAVSVRELPSSGSDRRYYRIQGPCTTMIGAVGDCPAENRAFVAIAGHLRKAGINVPQVYAVSGDFTAYLQEDLGDDTLFALKDDTDLLVKAIRKLPDIQFAGGRSMDYSVCYPQKEFDARMVTFDQNYFKYCFLKPSGIEFNENVLQDEFDRMAKDLTRCDTGNTFMYRDFQARNIMIRDGEPWFIDFQGGRRGPVYYDAASFIWQARAAYGKQLKERLTAEYIDSLGRYAAVDETELRANLRRFVLLRTIQVLGAYGFRGLIEHKGHFVESIPYAMDNIRELLETPFDEYPYLCRILCSLADKYSRKDDGGNGGLTVRVWSFSFRKGIPQDESGNGGGYVFDCRAIENPGKYDRYKSLTGLDAEVAEFLENEGGMARFLGHIYPMAEEHVNKYISRGFTSLQFCFGCTGGRHRSVYAAQHLAEHLQGKFPQVKVEIRHREI